MWAGLPLKMSVTVTFLAAFSLTLSLTLPLVVTHILPGFLVRIPKAVVTENVFTNKIKQHVICTVPTLKCQQ